MKIAKLRKKLNLLEMVLAYENRKNTEKIESSRDGIGNTDDDRKNT